jgi:phosphatidylglycerol:prolipoprotein diacylglycerol transferase
MQPTVHIVGVSIHTFGLAFALGFLAAGAVFARRLRELRLPVDWAYEAIFAALVGGLVGSRAYYIAQNYDKVRHDLLGSIFSGSGLVWYGGVIGGTLAMLAWARWRRMPLLALLDVSAIGLSLGYAVGRIGCQVSGDGDYGIRSDLPWAMGYPHGTVPTHPGVKVQPTPIYETLAMGLVAWALWRWRGGLRPGVLFAVYLVLSGTERLLVEFIRRNDVVLAGLTAPQLESIGLMVAGAAAFVWVARRGGVRLAAPTSPA